ncbi:acetyl-CoA synthetase-like protein [Nadsonia fulvescens var. elongata DSM 6958]|uniref:Acetyl-CoA synthetase-like protein n=1 Tax=Nadsonia fulvescens var. elongata DSM 6958 TaxID=857566 RepID=A0A1E3PMB5_9ASCO|nr:acetyl-CoA synthetase-like protein [Nadsonia fulvescens var. elongata DSM 6958]
MSTLQEIIAKTPINVPEHNANAVIIPHGPAFTSTGFLALVNRLRTDLASLNLPHQSAISISLPNSLEFAVSFLAATFSGYIAAPLNSAYKKSEFEFYIDDLKSKLVIVTEGAVERNDPAVQAARTFNAAIAEVSFSATGTVVDFNLVERAGLKVSKFTSLPSAKFNDIALVLHTSGTTGRPKAVPLTNLNLCTSIRNIVDTYNLSPKDTSYLVMPLFHVHGLMCGLLGALASGGAVIIPAKFSANNFWKDFIDYKANWYTAVPTIHQIILKHPLPSPIPEIRFIRSCSSSLAPSVFHELEKRLYAPVLEAYAMTEASHQMTSNPLPPATRKPGSVGLGQGVEVVILDDKSSILPHGKTGEISIRGKNVTLGYINNEKANAESFTNGYFRTGDQGYKDEDGYVFITGRIKELINRGGEKISPIELDGLLLDIEGVAEAVSFAAPDEMYGQIVNAAIVLKPNYKGKVTSKDIQNAMANKVAKFKVPTSVFFTDVMPKTATGKIQRRKIAETFLSKPKL